MHYATAPNPTGIRILVAFSKAGPRPVRVAVSCPIILRSSGLMSPSSELFLVSNIAHKIGPTVEMREQSRPLLSAHRWSFTVQSVRAEKQASVLQAGIRIWARRAKSPERVVNSC